MKECGYGGQCYCKSGIQFVNVRTCESCPDGQVCLTFNANVKLGSFLCYIFLLKVDKLY